MQKLEAIKNPVKTIKANKIDKKNTGNSKNTNNNLQFTEIFGQLSLALLPTKAPAVKPAQAEQADTMVTVGTPAKAKAENIGKTGQSAQTPPGKAEVGIAANLPNEETKLPGKTQVNESSSEAPAQLNADQVNRVKVGANGLPSVAKSEIKSNGSVSDNKVRDEVKSLVARTVGEMLNEVTSTNMGKGSESGIRVTANIMGRQISTVAKSMAGATGEKLKVAASNQSNSEGPSQIKIADLVLANRSETVEEPVLQSANHKFHSRPETPVNAMSPARIGNERTIDNQGKASNHDKEAGTDSKGTKTSTTKTEGVTNGLVIRENAAGELRIAEFEGVNVEKTMLGKNQTDFLVSKMIEQIKIAPSSLEVSLKPEYLGKINILVQSNAGVISVNVIAQNPEALNLLNANLPNIRENLEQQGVNIQQLDVNLANQEKQNNQKGYKFSGEKYGAPQVAETNAFMESGSLDDSERISLLSRNLNLLA